MDGRTLGQVGERRARWFYRLRGYRIVGTNVRLRGGELDLVVRRRSTLVFVEVKTRRSRTAGEGFDAVDQTKRHQIARVAAEYLAKMQPRNVQVRFDVVSIFFDGSRFTITHFEDAFRMESDPRRPWRWK